jgi:hypothetical protein
MNLKNIFMKIEEIDKYGNIINEQNFPKANYCDKYIVKFDNVTYYINKDGEIIGKFEKPLKEK